MKRWWKAVLVGLLGAVLVMFLVTWNPSFHGVEGLRQTLLSYGPWSVLISALLMILQATIAPLPANVTIVANGLVFGPVWGGLLSWVTILIGATICFALSKRFGKPFATRYAGRSLETAEKFFERYGLPAMLVIRVAPFVPFDAVSYVAGLAGVSYGKFLFATGVGVIPSIVVYSYLGSVAVGGLWWVALIAIAVSVVGVWVGARLLRKISHAAQTAAQPNAALPHPASLEKRSNPI